MLRKRTQRIYFRARCVHCTFSVQCYWHALRLNVERRHNTILRTLYQQAETRSILQSLLNNRIISPQRHKSTACTKMVVIRQLLVSIKNLQHSSICMDIPAGKFFNLIQSGRGAQSRVISASRILTRCLLMI